MSLGRLCKPIETMMKKYIGTKQIEAEPMTLGEACSKGLVKSEIERMSLINWDITLVLNMAMKLVTQKTV